MNSFLSYISEKVRDSLWNLINPATKEMQGSEVSIGNSTEVELAIWWNFTGEWADVLHYSEVIVSVHATENSATDWLVIQWSSNGIDIHGTDEFTITQNSWKTFSFPCQNRYVRVSYTNNWVIQSHFDLQTILKRYASKWSSHRLKDTLVQEDDAIVTKSLIAGKTTAAWSAIVDVKVNPSWSLQVWWNIWITDSLWANINPATSEWQDMTVLLKAILWALQYSRNADMTNNSDRVTVVNTVATTVSSITTLTNLQQMNWVQSELIPRMMEHSAWNLNVRSTIS